jgi:hypothetical protein
VISDDCRLERFNNTGIHLYVSKPEPYTPDGCASYATDKELEASFHRFTERGRFGQWDSKHEALACDNYRCRNCGAKVRAKSSCADHIEPVKSFANFRMADTSGNVQTLCKKCHLEKHRKQTT